MQSLMSYKTFTWPNNPTTFSVSEKRRTVQHPLLDGTWCTQEFGCAPRVFTGEGVFYGTAAYTDYLSLEGLVRAGGAGVLTHPQWGAISACLTALELTQEPKENYVRYRFTFVEAQT